MEKKSRILSTNDQFALLLEEMRQRPYLARGCTVFGARKQREWEQEWETIRENLNCRGPPCRTTKGWKKVWTSLKSRTTKKLTDKVAEVQKTGKGTSCTKLNRIEQEVVSILNLTENVFAPGTVHGIAEKALKRSYENLEDEGAMAVSHIICLTPEPLESGSDHNDDGSDYNVALTPPSPSMFNTNSSAAFTATSTAASTAVSDCAFNSTMPDIPRPKRCKEDNECLALIQQQNISQENISSSLNRILPTYGKHK